MRPIKPRELERSSLPTLTETEHMLLRAMRRAGTEAGPRCKSVVTLRYALLELQTWSNEIEHALCNAGDEEPLVAKYYNALCILARERTFADGAGDLSRPAGPRYTECWITPNGIEALDRSDLCDE